MSMKLRLAGLGGAAPQTFVDDVFSTYLYTGNGSTQTITNGIDLAGKGGMVWAKPRNNTNWHALIDTTRGRNSFLYSNDTSAATDGSFNSITSFNSTGFSLGIDSAGLVNASGSTYASWTFREAAKFFDVVTYTGTGSVQNIAHSLGVAPGMIIVKQYDGTRDWRVYSNGLTSAAYSLRLNSTAAQVSTPAVWNSTAPTSSVFSVGTDATVNASGGTYVAYLYAHDTSSTGIIQCGSFTTNGSGAATVNLGWEPQYLMLKASSVVRNWNIYDSMRGWPVGGNDAILFPNASAAEDSSVAISQPSATGFAFNETEPLAANATYIYMAIRRPNKPPTSGTQVYQGTTYSGNTTTITGTQLITTNLPVDLSIIQDRSNGNGTAFVDRLRGSMVRLQSAVTNGDISNSGAYKMDYQNNFLLGDYNWNYTGRNYVNHAFKRAPGFFDEVCWTGDGTNPRSLSHNLTVAPTLIITKKRNNTSNWITGYDFAATTYKYFFLNDTGAANSDTYASSPVYSGNPTNSVFIVGNQGNINQSGDTYVSYLFATLAGISKVGSYTGNGSSQNIECGFAAGARFVLIKRTDSTGDWFVWDTARGIVAANDPHLSLNTTAAEVTTDDSIDPYSAGFTVNQVAATNINVSSATYIYLAIA